MRLRGTRAGRWALASAAGLVIVSWAMAASGAPFDLLWSAPAGCPSREEIVDATRAHLGESPSEALPELFVQGTVRAVRGGFTVTLALKDASGHPLGEREVRVEQQSCRAIEEPTSVVLAMMIAVARPRVEERGPREERVETPPASAPEAMISPAPAPAPAPASAAVPPPPPLSDRLLVAAAGVGSIGMLPNPGLGFALRAMYAPRSIVLVGLEASFEAGGSVRFANGEVGFQLFGVSARLGVSVVRTARFELIPTVGARGGALRALPTGLKAVDDQIRATMLAGPGALVRVELGPGWFVDALPEVEVAIVRDRLQIRNGTKLYSIHRPSLFDVRVSLGLGYEFR